MFLRSSNFTRIPLFGIMAGAAALACPGLMTGSAHATALPSSVLIDNFSQDTVGAAPSEVIGYQGQTLTVVSSGTADGNMLQVKIANQYSAQLQFGTAGTTPANWDNYQDISFDLLFPNTSTATLYPGTSIDVQQAGYQGGGQTTQAVNLGTGGNGIYPSVPSSNASTTLVPVNIPISQIPPAVLPGSWFQVILNIYPGYDSGATGPWTFDMGNVQFTNPVTSTIPEPATIGLLAIGGLGLLLLGRRRRLV